MLEEHCDQFSISDKLLLLLSESRTCAVAIHIEGLPVLIYMKTVLLCRSWGMCFSARDEKFGVCEEALQVTAMSTIASTFENFRRLKKTFQLA